MTSKQESKLKMYLVVKEFVNLYLSIANALPNFSEFFAAFVSAITQIQTHGEQQKFNKSGLKTSKGELKKILVALAVDASRKLQAYAKYTKNQLLLSETKYPESDLKSAADNALRDIAQGLYDRGQSNLAALEIYGLTAETQTALLNAINAFVESIPKPRLGSNDKKQSTLLLANGYKAADEALDNMDTLVEIVKVSQANFYNGYQSAKKMVATGSGSLTVKGLVNDAITGEALKGVLLSFVLESNAMLAKSAKDAVTLVKKTAAKGGFNIKSLAAGVYVVTISKYGYADQTVNISVTPGEQTVLNIQLVKK